MNLKELSEIINSPLMDDDFKKKCVIISLAKDKSVISDILQILAEERAKNKELILDMNLELSRAHIFIEEVKPSILGKKEKQTGLGSQVTKNFILDKISAFYVKYKHSVTHCFNRFN